MAQGFSFKQKKISKNLFHFMLSKIGERRAVGGDLLCFFYRLFHGKEDTIDENGEHDHVVEVLVG